MKLILLVSMLFLTTFVGKALSQACPGASTATRQSAAQIETAFKSNLVCASKSPNATGNDRWSEEHTNTAVSLGSFQLNEFAMGQGHPVDPRRVNIGTWRGVAKGGPGKSTNNDVVEYVYTPGGTFTWSVWLSQTSATYYFCDAAGSTLIATTKSVNGIPAPTASNPCGW